MFDARLRRSYEFSYIRDYGQASSTKPNMPGLTYPFEAKPLDQEMMDRDAVVSG